MIQEKGIDPIAVDKIGKYVELKGTTNVLFLFTLFKCDTEIFLMLKKDALLPCRMIRKSFNGNMGFLC